MVASIQLGTFYRKRGITSCANSSMLRRASSLEAPGRHRRRDDVVGWNPVQGALDCGGDIVRRAGHESGAQIFVGLIEQLPQRILLAEVGRVVVPLAVGVAQVALVRLQLFPERVRIVRDVAAG